MKALCLMQFVSDSNGTESNSQEETSSSEEIPKTSTQNIKKHENLERIRISMLQVEFFTFKHFLGEKILI